MIARSKTALLAVTLAAVIGGEAHAAAPENLKYPLKSGDLSNEETVTRWAFANGRYPIRSDPSGSAKTVGRLRMTTEDGHQDVFLALKAHVDGKKRTWIQVRVLGRPNGRTGWVREEQLGPLNTVRTQLIIDRGKLRATLLKRGKKIFSARVGVGKSATPTPAGRFYIRELLRNFGGNGVYGPYAFGTSAYSILSDWPGGGVVGIHGTNQPGLIPGRPSHGCVRMRNADIRRLKRLMPIGTPVQII